MLARALTDEVARRRLGEAVTAAEQHTSVELVLVVRARASRYLRTSLLAGAGAAAVTLALLLLLPQAYDVRYFALDALLAFVLVAYLVDSLAALQRVLTPAASRTAALEAAGAHAFESLGVARTRDRTGVLVYLALLERTAWLVPDVGVEPERLAPSASAARRALDAAVHDRDLDGVVRALEALGRELASSHPRSEHDENQLPDVVHT